MKPANPTASNGAVTADGLTVRYGQNTAIDGVSFTATSGDSVALIGPNGSGKTTVLRCLARLLTPTAGTVNLPDGTVTAYVSQHASAPSWLPLTAREVIQMGRFGQRGLIGRLSKRDKTIVAEAAERLGVADLLTNSYGDLSGGQRQRVRLAQALAQEPTVLLLDEPITGLDLTSQHRILELVDEETERGTIVFLTTHNLDETRHCSRVLLINSKVVAIGPPAEVLTATHLRDAFGARVLGDHADHDHDQTLLMVDDHGHAHHRHYR